MFCLFFFLTYKYKCKTVNFNLKKNHNKTISIIADFFLFFNFDKKNFDRRKKRSLDVFNANGKSCLTRLYAYERNTELNWTTFKLCLM